MSGLCIILAGLIAAGVGFLMLKKRSSQDGPRALPVSASNPPAGTGGAGTTAGPNGEHVTETFHIGAQGFTITRGRSAGEERDTET